MGLIQNGTWVDQWYDTKATGGSFERQDSAFRHWIGTAGEARSDGRTEFPAEPGRYHLYVSLACPWAHRTLIFRRLKQLEELVTVSVVKPLMLEKGWELDEHPYGEDYLYQLYLRAAPQYQGRVTVPVLWDKHSQRLVNNESAEIIRMFNSAFDSLTGNRRDYYPAKLRSEIDAINARVYDSVNNGVYRAGFATSQAAYEEAVESLFASLDWLEQRLERQRYLVGERQTEADWRLFTTLIRFDAVYFGHFKTNRQSLASYPNLSNYVRELYQTPGIAETVNFDHIKTHYYASHRNINPSGIVPTGPVLDFDQPHNRDRFGA